MFSVTQENSNSKSSNWEKYVCFALGLQSSTLLYHVDVIFPISSLYAVGLGKQCKQHTRENDSPQIERFLCGGSGVDVHHSKPTHC